MCDRFMRGDLERWRRLYSIDKKLAFSPRLSSMEDAAIDEMRKFRNSGRCYLGVSWGKDSVVLAHMACRAQLDIKLVWVVIRPLENPYCFDVRDDFMARFSVEYVEAVDDRVRGLARRNRHGVNWLTPEEGVHGLDLASVSTDCERYISGVRSEESSARASRQAMFGVSTARTCAPITRWKGEDVFAYLAKYDLPIHPAYAMSFGGRLDRRRLRVHSLGGEAGDEFGRGEVESAYYRDELYAIMHTIDRPEDAPWIRLWPS